MACDFGVGETAICDPVQHRGEPSVVVKVAHGERERALVLVAQEVERIDADVRPVQTYSYVFGSK